VIQLTLAVAAQAHSDDVVTDTVPAPPPASMGLGGGDRATWHLTGVGPVLVSDVVPHAAAAKAADTMTKDAHWADEADAR
jgi:hypothetical protein